MSRLANIEAECAKDHVKIDGRPYYITNHSFVREIRPRGSNGVVFETYDQFLERRDAVKIWIPVEEDDRDRQKQALAEARKVAQLNHKNIVQIYSCNQFADGLIYAIMEFIDGATLKDYLKKQHPEFEECARIWSGIAEAIEYSHEHNVYHGDLHAGNIMVIGRNVKVIDFGTSIFASKKTRSRDRETTLLLKLGQQLFPGTTLNLNEIADTEIRRLKPELALSALSTWISILWDWPSITRIVQSKRYDDLYHALLGLAFDVSSAPIFSVHKLADMLKKDGISVSVTLINGMKVNSVDLFFGCCVYWAQVRLFHLDDGSAKKGRMVEPSSIPLDRQSNELQLRTLWPELKFAFQRSGPFD